jgi:hypothetical protein
MWWTDSGGRLGFILKGTLMLFGKSFAAAAALALATAPAAVAFAAPAPAKVTAAQLQGASAQDDDTGGGNTDLIGLGGFVIVLGVIYLIADSSGGDDEPVSPA